jgi:tetratricopeptide (TPR) repeat protein
MFKKILLISIWLLLAVFCFGQSNFSRGEQLLMQNQPGLALSFLENAIRDDSANVTAWIYLGLVYEQLDRYDDAIAIYRRILPSAGSLSANVANNLGNVYFHRGNIEEAERYFTQAIGFDSVFPYAYLGRANTRIKAGNLQNALSDYEQYLTLNPRSSQRRNIEQLIGLINTEIAAAEMRRILAEEEERRIAEERQKLLESVSASLQSAADYSRGISTGAEGIEGYEDEFVLD